MKDLISSRYRFFKKRLLNQHQYENLTQLNTLQTEDNKYSAKVKDVYLRNVRKRALMDKNRQEER